MEANRESTKRPTDADQPNAKRRAQGAQGGRDDADEEENEEDPGQWNPVDPSVIAGRRKVRVRRAGEETGAALPPSAPTSSNPFSGISLLTTAPPPVPAASNPFSGISLVPPVPAATEPPTLKGTPLPEDPPKQNATPSSFGFGSYSSNAFASLNNGANTTPIGGFGGGGFGGGGFGSAISKAPTATPPASPLFGALPTPGTSGFSFTTGAFPSIAPQAAFNTPGEGDGDGDETVELFAESTAVFKPVVTLPEAKKTVTGEEEEMTVYSASDAVLYEFITSEDRQKWVERGKGEFRLNFDKGDHVPKARMILRQAGSLRLLLNASIFSNMACSLMAGDVGISFGAHNAAAPSITPQDSKAADTNGSTSPVSPLLEGPNASNVSTWAVKIRGRGSDPATRLFSLINEHKEALDSLSLSKKEGDVAGTKVEDESKV